MSCLKPIKIRNKRYTSNSNIDFSNACQDFYNSLGYVQPPDKFIEVPCGKCVSCLKTRRNGWRMRLMAEFYRYPSSAFITLTFNDESLDKFKDNPNKAVRLFLDRFRKFFGKSIRHFIVPEFGSKTERLHYHGILFNLPPIFDEDVLASIWKYGFVYVGYCNAKTINYVIKYITKPDSSNMSLPRLIVSKGVGISFLESYGVDIKDNYQPYFVSNGYKIPLPRYYLTKLFTEVERVCMQYLSSLQPFVRYVDGQKCFDLSSYKHALKQYYDKLSAISVVGLSEKPKVDSLKDFSFFETDFSLEENEHIPLEKPCKPLF